MRTSYINLSFIIISAWLVYAHCQADSLLPIVGTALLALTFILRFKTSAKNYVFFKKLPLSAIIISSFIAGLYWRSMFPPPEATISPFPTMTAAFQAGSIFASVFLWLQPFTQRNMYRLFFSAWLTVATSMNTSFNPTMFFYFSLFCLINLAVILMHTMKKPPAKKDLFRYYRDFTLFSILLVGLSIGLFYGISRGIYTFDNAFMNFMNDYVLPRNYSHFLRMDPRLTLDSPGESAWDKRPILEITLPRGNGIYLKMQNFKFFDNGTWVQSENTQKTPLPQEMIDGLYKLDITMFTSLDDIIPSPRNVFAARSNSLISRTGERTLHAADKAPSRIVQLSVSELYPNDDIHAEERRDYLTLPPSIAAELKTLASEIIGSETDPREKTKRLRDYFHDHFQYSLFPNFTADNQGILAMIKEKRPAYCSYFASGLTLLLRAADIPSRVVTGLMITDEINPRKNKYLARVSDAHAWVEVLLPLNDPSTNTPFDAWQIFDPTPGSVISEALGAQGFNIQKYTDMLFLSMLRFKANVENIDKERMKRNMLLFLMLALLLMNLKKIGQSILHVLRRRQKKAPPKDVVPGDLNRIYRRYETYIKNEWEETRCSSDTDQDVLERLRKKPAFSDGYLRSIETFLKKYRSARFGQNVSADLEETLKALEKGPS